MNLGIFTSAEYQLISFQSRVWCILLGIQKIYKHFLIVTFDFLSQPPPFLFMSLARSSVIKRQCLLQWYCQKNKREKQCIFNFPFSTNGKEENWLCQCSLRGQSIFSFLSLLYFFGISLGVCLHFLGKLN